MKKLMLAALLACSMCVFADDPATPKPEAADKPPRAERQKLTPEQREQFMAARKARMAERQGKVIDALKEAGLTDEQAKATADKIEKIYMPGPGGHGPRPGHNGKRRNRGEAK